MHTTRAGPAERTQPRRMLWQRAFCGGMRAVGTLRHVTAAARPPAAGAPWGVRGGSLGHLPKAAGADIPMPVRRFALRAYAPERSNGEGGDDGYPGRPSPSPGASGSGSGPVGGVSFNQRRQYGESLVGAGTIRDALAEYDILLPHYRPGDQRICCPQCTGGREKEKCLAIRIEDDSRSALFNCFRGKCGWTGKASTDTPRRTIERPGWEQGPSMKKASWTAGGPRLPGAAAAGPATVVARAGGRKKGPPTRPSGGDLKDLGPEALKFFQERRISMETLRACGVRQAVSYAPALRRETLALAFPYTREGEIVNVKYRALEEKTFWQVKGAEKILYGLDDVEATGAGPHQELEEVIIVEGEIDKLSLYEAGFPNTVSVPDGAPPKVKEGPVPIQEADTKYEYIWNCRGMLDRARRIIIATDNDGPGSALAEEISRRLGRERCYRVLWPGDPAEPDGAGFRKDANDVLVRDGAEALADCISGAEEYPIRGLFRFSDFASEIDAYYNSGDDTEERGVGTGWGDVDEFYRVVPGDLTVVTGVPNSGKSEWIDALIANLSVLHGWSFALCSMENKVRDHARKLVEKFIGRPFFTGQYAKGERMSAQDLELGKEWLDDNFFLIRCEDDELPSVDWVLELARVSVMRHGIRGLVIDPYNELDHQRPSNMSETEYVSQMLTKIKRFAQSHDCHVWFVAHPRQMRDWNGEAPQLYDISGSAHFVNKCDNGIVVHRNRDPEKAPLDHVTIHVRKVRNKVAGGIGDATLRYRRDIGRYIDL